MDRDLLCMQHSHPRINSASYQIKALKMRSKLEVHPGFIVGI